MKKEVKPQSGKSQYAWFYEALDQHLAKQGLKQTKQRHLIVQLFLDLESHVSAEDLHAAARKKGFSFGLATIYRTLKLLQEAGLVEQKQFSEGRYVFEVKAPGSHHDHLICLSCGKVIEFENEAIEELQEKIAKSYGFELISHRLDLFGRCQKGRCSGK